MKNIFNFAILVGSIILFSCSSDQKRAEDALSLKFPEISESFADYWYSGNAELNKYKLSQSRYGESHEAEAVLIFVTEDFLLDKQVKYEGFNSEAARTTVLKLNQMRSFQTGVYPYHMMNSVFSPIDIEKFPNALKSTTSIQEWCGQSFAQLNRTDKGYRYQLRSYFEQEGDRDASFKGKWIEDEIFTYIRIAPHKLPTGKFKMLPSSFYQRLSHRELDFEEVNATIKQEGEIFIYEIEYPKIFRKIQIQFEKKFPYQITSWEEEYKSSADMPVQKSTATLQSTAKLDYWRRNKSKDQNLLKNMWRDAQK